jgi:hypothetical protein
LNAARRARSLELVGDLLDAEEMDDDLENCDELSEIIEHGVSGRSGEDEDELDTSANDDLRLVR